jgi:4-hydroxybenzoate polyprenyltransferase
MPINSAQMRNMIWSLTACVRPISSLVVGVLTFAIYCSGTRGDVTSSISAGAAFCFVAMAGFVMNDIYDEEKDRFARVARPIAVGSVSIQAAKFLAVVLWIAAYSVGPKSSTSALVILSSTLIALLLYSPFARRFPIVKGVYTACLCCTPVLYAATAAGIAIPLRFYVVLCIFVLGRETYMDAIEMAGDDAAGLRTIAVVLGYGTAKIIAGVLLILSSIALVYLARTPIGLFMSGIGGIITLTALMAPSVSATTRVSVLRIPMLLGSIAIAVSVS